eukprot:m.21338 g.21338  ORF g.21338 m.21338 type:complete len:879 (+) comp28162_c0_seq2:1117-3753(+)
MLTSVEFLVSCLCLVVVCSNVDAQGWTNWTQWSSCSRTCESGVRSRTRSCQSRSQPCTGPSKEHESCNTTACPDDAIDFRTQQCASYNSRPLYGYNYQWVPYNDGEERTKCSLYCKATGFNFYRMMADKVVDGTRFSEATFDLCVDGRRTPAGCDGVLYSKTVMDQCGVCNGTNSSCNLYCDVTRKSRLFYGYNKILTIPKDADLVKVEEVAATKNFLAIKRNANQEYLLNGGYRILPSGTFSVAGASCVYEREPGHPEKLTCNGKLTEAIDIMLLYQTADLGISYCYALPKGVNATLPVYSWQVRPVFTICSASCGGGHRHKPVSCIHAESGRKVDHSNCDSSTKPSAERQVCNNLPCPPTWNVGNWSNCDARCGKGFRTRPVTCISQISRAFVTPVSDIMCTVTGNLKPAAKAECYSRPCTSSWTTGSWSKCSAPCGNGLQARSVSCSGICEQTLKPSRTRPCNLGECRWRASSWSMCSVECGNGNSTRTVSCGLSSGGNPVREQLCGDEKPSTEKVCSSDPCKGTWTVGTWAKCSSSCGNGNQTRPVTCNVSLKNGVRTECDPSEKPIGVRPCRSECRYSWYASPWSECSVSCGDGAQSRTVQCVEKEGAVVGDRYCNASAKPAAIRECRSVNPCELQWVVGSWSKCSVTCGNGVQTRLVACSYYDDVDDSSVLLSKVQCSALGSEPASKRNCTEIQCPNTWNSRCNPDCHPVKEVHALCSSDSNDAILPTKKCTSLPDSIEVCYSENCQITSNIRALPRYYLPDPEPNPQAKQKPPRKPEPEPEPTDKPEPPTQLKPQTPKPQRQPQSQSVRQQQPEPEPHPVKKEQSPPKIKKPSFVCTDQNKSTCRHLASKRYCNRSNFKKYCCRSCRKVMG